MIARVFFTFFIFHSVLYSMTVDHAYFQLGQTLKQSNTLEEAIIYFEKTVACNPQHVPALYELGMYQYQHGALEKALNHFAALLTVDPYHQDAGLHAGLCALALQRYDLAIGYYKKIIEHEPRFPKAHFFLAMAYRAHQQLPEAIESFKTTLSLSPESWEAHFHLANALRLDHHLAQALHHYEQALEKNPTNMAIVFEHANALSQSGNIEKALMLYEQLHENHYQSPLLAYNMAYTYKKKGDYAKAATFYRIVLKEGPLNYQAHIGLASAYLAQEQYASGFQELALSAKVHITEKPVLTTIADARNKTILITASWNNEDMIQFLRYLPVLKQHGAHLIVQTNAVLAPLFKHCSYIDHVLEQNTHTVPDFDFHIPMIAIPALCAGQEATLTCTSPYLSLNDFRWPVKQKKRLGYPAIGISWKSRELADDQAEDKNIPFSTLAPLMQDHTAQWYALDQLSYDELTALDPEGMITILGKGINPEKNILSFTALIATLDIIITGDSLVAHIAGALGKPTILVIPQISQWRWIARNGHSLFYPCMHVIRATKNDQPGITCTIKECLEKYYRDYNYGILA